MGVRFPPEPPIFQSFCCWKKVLPWGAFQGYSAACAFWLFIEKAKSPKGFWSINSSELGSGRSYSSIAQLVEHSTVNRMVAGSSPARGASFAEASAKTLAFAI